MRKTKEESKKIKQPVTQEKIFRIMIIMTFAVAALFLAKNLLSHSLRGSLVIGACLLCFAAVIVVMKALKVRQVVQQLVLSMCLVLLVFVISANSGSYYSDDFPLYLAIIGLTGIYLEPHYTKYQMVLITILLIVLYFLHPEKADPLSQYLMCVVMFDIAAFTFYLAIKRGRAFIEQSMEKAREAERLLNSLKTVGDELQKNYENSSGRIGALKSANDDLQRNVSNLQAGSLHISEGTRHVRLSCEQVQEQVSLTGSRIGALNTEVKKVEQALTGSKVNMEHMDKQMDAVRNISEEANEVFALLKDQIHKISQATGELAGIAFNTNILALNASVEAARAGSHGAGFSVVAENVRSLAAESDDCSDRVSDIVGYMGKQVEKTALRLEESLAAVQQTVGFLAELKDAFGDLSQNFNTLYDSIEEQNENIANVGSIFSALQEKVAEMSDCADENQAAVESIVQAMSVYQENTNMVIKDTEEMHNLSASMLKKAEEA